jgi:hypothetical protein
MKEKRNDSFKDGADTKEKRAITDVPEVSGGRESPDLSRNQPPLIPGIDSTVPDEEIDDGGFLCL